MLKEALSKNCFLHKHFDLEALSQAHYNHISNIMKLANHIKLLSTHTNAYILEDFPTLIYKISP